MSDLKKIPRFQLMNRIKDAVLFYGLSDKTVGKYCEVACYLCKFMEDNNFEDYTQETGQLFIRFLETKTSLYSARYLERFNTFVRTLNCILEGIPLRRRRTPHIEYKLPNNETGNMAKELITLLRTKRLSNESIYHYTRYLYLFVQYMIVNEVSFKELNENHIFKFMDSYQNGVRATCAMVIKRFMTYIYEKGIVLKDLSSCLRGYKDERTKPIISYYTPDEIGAIETSVDRTTPIGKRNYAIILLASRLGLRSSDIRKLKFSNLDWDNNLIKLQQYKTKRVITLPLLNDVGNAIIDYAKNGRPKCSIKNIFVSSRRPFVEMETISAIFSKHIACSGVSTTLHHIGGHSLRHSLATSLMQNGTNLPVISEVLGHESSETTMIYLGINVNALLECSMIVPAIDDSFYTQQGGVLYGK